MGGLSPLHLIIALPLLLLLVVGPVALVIALLANRKTRKVTLVVLLALPVVLVTLLFAWRESAHVASPRAIVSQQFGDGTPAPWNTGLPIPSDPRVALANLRRAAAQNPNSAEAHCELAKSLTDLTQYDEAVMHYRKALQLKPDFVQAYCGLGQLLNARGRYGDAFDYFQMALKLDPKCVDGHLGLAAVFVAQKRFDEAVAEYQKAHELKPDDAATRDSLKKVMQEQASAEVPAAAAASPAAAESPSLAPIAVVPPQAAAVQTASDKTIAVDSASSEKVKDQEKGTTTQPKEVKAQKTPGNARPAWVGTASHWAHDVYEMPITIGPYTTMLECDAELPAAIRRAVDQYIEIALGSGAIGTASRLDADFCRQLAQARWEEVSQLSVGPMTQLHVLLRFDRQAKERILDACKEGIVAQRLRLTGLWLAAGLAVLTLLYGLLRITASRAKVNQDGFTAPTGESSVR